MSLMPSSLNVGTSGKDAARCGRITPSALTLPDLIISTAANESNEKSTSPATTACIWGLVPLYCALMRCGALITCLNCSVIRLIIALPDEMVSGLSLFCASAISSCIELTGRSLRAITTKPTVHTLATGAKLAAAS
ncbi:hypothetical protein D3C71_1733210 [compost metagenome]